MEYNNPIVHYLCDGEMENCRKKVCYKTIGDCEKACKYTKDIRHAKNFEKRRPEIEQAGYWEKENKIAPDEQTQSPN